MKTLGIIGGMSPESTVTYYSLINQLVNQQDATLPFFDTTTLHAQKAAEFILTE